MDPKPVWPKADPDAATPKALGAPNALVPEPVPENAPNPPLIEGLGAPKADVPPPLAPPKAEPVVVGLGVPNAVLPKAEPPDGLEKDENAPVGGLTNDEPGVAPPNADG